MKRLRYIVCVSLLILISGCVAPPIAETWEGYRVTEDVPIDVSKPKLGKLPQAKVYWYEVRIYRTIYWPWEWFTMDKGVQGG